MAATIVTIPTLIDIALGTAEAGTVNFNVLKSLLHVIVQQLDLREIKVAFRGNDSETVQGLMVGIRENTGWQPDFKDLSSEELSIKVEEGDEEKAPDTAMKRKSTDTGETVYIVESGKVIDMVKSKPPGVQVSPSSFARLEGKVKVLQNQVEMLGAQALPSNEALLEATRSSEGQPIQNLWQNINITKRMSGAEEGIDKLASLLETVAKEYADLKTIIDKMQEEFGQDVPDTINQIKLAASYAKKLRPREEAYASYLRPKTLEGVEREQLVINAEDGEGNEGEGGEGVEDEPVTSRRLHRRHHRPHHHREQHDDDDVPQEGVEDQEKKRGSKTSVSSKEETKEGSMGQKRSSERSSGAPSWESSYSVIEEFQEGDITPENMNKLLGQYQRMRTNIDYVTAQVNTLADFADIILPEILQGLPQMEELKHKIAKIRGETGSQVTLTEEELREKREHLSLELRMDDAETALAKHWALLRRQDAMICDRTGILATRIGSLEKDVDVINKKLHIGMEDQEDVLNEELAKNPVIMGIAAVGEELTNNIKDLAEAIAEIIADKQASEQIVHNLMEEVELMMNSKADRFELDDILAEKADCNLLNQKVSMEQFDNSCNDFKESLAEAAEKQETYERIIQSSLNDLQHLLDTKFDREEAIPLREYLEHSLADMNRRLDQLAAIKQGNLTAAAKKELMTDLTCITCGQEAVMYLENKPSDVPALPQCPGGLSIQPFIAFELDRMRQLRAKNPKCRNMVQYEDLMKQYMKHKSSQKEPMTYACNRYVGGSHTMLGPNSRVVTPGPEQPSKHPSSPRATVVVTSVKESSRDDI